MKRNECPASVIKNCFDHCLRQGTNISEEERGCAASSTVDSMVRYATEHGVEFTRVGLEKMLNPEEEDDVTEDATIEDLAREVAGEDEAFLEPTEAEELDEEEPLTVDQELRCLAQARAILERIGHLPDGGRKAFYCCQRSLRLERASAMKQTTILDHFRKK